MSDKFPSYTTIFNLTVRRIKGFKKIKERSTEQLKPEDEFLFLIIGNINLRLKTIFFLLENDITDGIFPLQRSLFELQTAFQVYMNAENKTRFIEIYNDKHRFEHAIKWDRVVMNDNDNIFTDEERKVIENFKVSFRNNIESKSKQSIFKLWFEIAAGQTLNDLSKGLYNSTEYYINYDEPSNWVHPQRLEENLNLETYNQQLYFEYFEIFLMCLIWDLDKLNNDMAQIAKYFGITKSQRLFKYGEDIVELINALREVSDEMERRKNYPQND